MPPSCPHSNPPFELAMKDRGSEGIRDTDFRDKTYLGISRDDAHSDRRIICIRNKRMLNCAVDKNGDVMRLDGLWRLLSRRVCKFAKP